MNKQKQKKTEEITLGSFAQAYIKATEKKTVYGYRYTSREQDDIQTAMESLVYMNVSGGKAEII